MEIYTLIGIGLIRCPNRIRGYVGNDWKGTEMIVFLCRNDKIRMGMQGCRMVQVWDCNKKRDVYLPPTQLHRQQLSSSGAARLAAHAESFYLVACNHPS